MEQKVIVYLINECPYCEKLEKLLNEANIEHTAINIDTKEGDELFKPVYDLTKSEMVPTIVIGERILVPEISFMTIDMAFKLIKMTLSGEV
jgi:glutaredoxin